MGAVTGEWLLVEHANLASYLSLIELHCPVSHAMNAGDNLSSMWKRCAYDQQYRNKLRLEP